MGIYNEIHMLEGNINRLCVTDDRKEIETMREWAKIRVDIIADYRLKVLEEIEGKIR